ncbi:MAG: FABP family protein [Muribaculaceae bacterium]|nr:FABP family protein [Muribaculaceae bacterium]
MKKYLKLLFAAIFATLSFALVSCGDDDDDNGALVGTWVGSYPEYDGTSYTDEVTFTKDGKFSSTSYHRQIYVRSVNGTYTVSGDLKEGAVVYMVGVDSDGDNVDARIIAKVSGDLLYTIDTEGDTIVFTRK